MAQFTQEFTRLDGCLDKAVIITRRSSHGYSAAIKIGRIQKTVTATHRDENDAFTVALRALFNHRDNVIA